MFGFLRSVVVVALLLPLISAKPRARNHTRDIGIYGGNQAANGQFPYQIYLYNQPNDEVCGGVIYDAWNLITASHCVNDNNGNPLPANYFTVYVGSNVRGNGAAYSVNYITTNPGWHAGTPNNDISIIRLNNALQMNQNVQPLATGPFNPNPGGLTVVHQVP